MNVEICSEQVFCLLKLARTIETCISLLMQGWAWKSCACFVLVDDELCGDFCSLCWHSRVPWPRRASLSLQAVLTECSSSHIERLKSLNGSFGFFFFLTCNSLKTKLEKRTRNTLCSSIQLLLSESGKVCIFYAEAEKLHFQAYETFALHWGRSLEELKSQTLIRENKTKHGLKKVKEQLSVVTVGFFFGSSICLRVKLIYQVSLRNVIPHITLRIFF